MFHDAEKQQTPTPFILQNRLPVKQGGLISFKMVLGRLTAPLVAVFHRQELGGQEVLARESVLARAAGTNQDDETEFGDGECIIQTTKGDRSERPLGCESSFKCLVRFGRPVERKPE